MNEVGRTGIDLMQGMTTLTFVTFVSVVAVGASTTVMGVAMACRGLSCPSCRNPACHRREYPLTMP